MRSAMAGITADIRTAYPSGHRVSRLRNSCGHEQMKTAKGAKLTPATTPALWLGTQRYSSTQHADRDDITVNTAAGLIRAPKLVAILPIESHLVATPECNVPTSSLPLALEGCFINIMPWRVIHAMTRRGSNSRRQNWIGNLSGRRWSYSSICVPTGGGSAPP